MSKLFTVEHNLGIASGLYLSKSCWNVRSAQEAYFRLSFTDFFTIFGYNVYLGVLVQGINFYWSVMFENLIKRGSHLCAFLQHVRLELH